MATMIPTTPTPKEIVSELDKHIVGQADAKRAVAVALRNRWRRMQLTSPLRDEIMPKNILMIGDRFSDYEAAHTTGSPFVFCEYGHAVKDEISDFSIKITNLSDLLNYL